MKVVIHRLFGPAVGRYLMAHAWRRGPMPFPDDTPVVHGPGPDPDRILLLGGILVGGIGVRSHELGIAGHLARKLAARTGHGADVEAHGISMLTIPRAEQELRGEHLQRFDGIVLMLGNGELLTMRPSGLWRRDLQKLLATIAELAPNGPPVILTAVPPVANAFDVPNFLRRRIARAIDGLNDELRLACAEASTGSASITFVDFDGDGPAPRVGSRAADAYEQWATAIASQLAVVISEAAPQMHGHFVPISESERQSALDELGVVGSDSTAIVDHIVAMARDMLGASAASLTLIDNDRQWTMSASGIASADIPRSGAICNTTIQTPGVFMVEDAAANPEFQSASWVAGDEQIRSYVGYPVEAPGGHRVGALCVMDRSPRRFTPEDVATLRDLALRAQHQLWVAT